VRRFIIVLVGVALVALFVVAARAVVGTSGVQSFAAAAASGERPATPGFDLETLDGARQIDLDDLRGKVVVVNFWASWCDPCKDEAPLIEDLSRSLGAEDDVEFVGIATQDLRSDARAFADTYGLTYPLVYDEGGTVGRDWGVSAYPETFVIDPEGRAVAWFPGVIRADRLREAVGEARG
jgi:cytochrome c biogenesis protein CcmG/thiol:disulfide interchange protein DsbE